MLEKLEDLPPGIDGVKATGTVSREDYEQVLEPMLERARSDGRRVRFLYQVGLDFDGFTPGAAWEDAKVGLRFLQLFDGCAIVSDVVWLREATRLARFVLPCPVKSFGYGELDAATAWAGGASDQGAASSSAG